MNDKNNDTLYVSLPGYEHGSRNLACANDVKGTETARQFDIKGILEVLQMVQSQIHGNYELIKTWQATYRFEDKIYFNARIPGAASTPQSLRLPESSNRRGFWGITNGLLTFHLDVELDKLSVHFQPDASSKIVDAKTGRALEPESHASEYQWIVTPEHWLDFEVNGAVGQIDGFQSVPSVPSAGNRVLHRHIPGKARAEGRFVDPRDFFSNGTRFFWQECELFVAALRGERTKKEQHHANKYLSMIERPSQSGEGKEYVWTIRYPRPGVNESENQMKRVEVTFDSTVGFNPTSWKRIKQGFPSESRTLAFQNFSGVFLPAQLQLERFVLVNGDSPRLEKSRRFTLVKSRLNEPIDPSHFDIDEFQLDYGERLLDHIQNRLYVKDETGFVELEEFRFDPTKLPGTVGEQHNLPWSIVAILANIAVVAALLFLIWHRRAAARFID